MNNKDQPESFAPELPPIDPEVDARLRYMEHRAKEQAFDDARKIHKGLLPTNFRITHSRPVFAPPAPTIKGAVRAGDVVSKQQ